MKVNRPPEKIIDYKRIKSIVKPFIFCIFAAEKRIYLTPA